MEPTMIYTNTTNHMSTCYSNSPSLVHNQEILIHDSSNKQEGLSFPSQVQNSNPDFIRKEHVPTFIDDIEDEESEFKMGRLIRQASLNSSKHISTPQQTTKVMRGSSTLPKYFSQKPEINQEKIIKLRRVESMNERNRKKLGKKNGGAPAIPGGLVDNDLSDDIKAQIKSWARSVAFNLHQEC